VSPGCCRLQPGSTPLPLLTSQAYTAQDTKPGLKGLESRFSPFPTIPPSWEANGDLHVPGRLPHTSVRFCTISNAPGCWQTFLSPNALSAILRSQYQRVDNATMCLAQLRQDCNNGAIFTGFTYTAQDIKIPNDRDRDQEDGARYGTS
jgi:hypothetical protein